MPKEILPRSRLVKDFDEASQRFRLEEVDPTLGDFSLHAIGRQDPIQINISGGTQRERIRQVALAMQNILTTIPQNLSSLTDLERKLIVSTYGLDNTGVKTHTEASKLLGVTPVGVYSAVRLGLKKLELLETYKTLSKFSHKTPNLGLANDEQAEEYARAFENDRGYIFGFFLNRTGNPELAEDLTSQVFLQGFEAISNGNYKKMEGLPIRAWLLRISKNKLYSYRRHPPVEYNHPDLFWNSIPDDKKDSPFETIDRGSALGSAIARLPEAQREVIMLRFMSDLSVSDTARVLGKKEINVRVTQTKAIKRLRRILERE